MLKSNHDIVLCDELKTEIVHSDSPKNVFCNKSNSNGHLHPGNVLRYTNK